MKMIECVADADGAGMEGKRLFEGLQLSWVGR